MLGRFRTAFFAFPAEPNDLFTTIVTAAEAASRATDKISIKTWPETDIFGAALADQVRHDETAVLSGQGDCPRNARPRVKRLAGAISELGGGGLRLEAWRVRSIGKRSDLLSLQFPHFEKGPVLIVLGDAKVIRSKKLVRGGLGQAGVFDGDLPIAVRPSGAVVCSMEHDRPPGPVAYPSGNSPFDQGFREPPGGRSLSRPSGLFGVTVAM
jgi:hypothetical protein